MRRRHQEIGSAHTSSTASRQTIGGPANWLVRDGQASIAGRHTCWLRQAQDALLRRAVRRLDISAAQHGTAAA